MTEKQYENLMYALSTLIALMQRQNMPCSVTDIPYDTVKQIEKRELRGYVEEAYKDLTGSQLNREEAYEKK